MKKAKSVVSAADEKVERLMAVAAQINKSLKTEGKVYLGVEKHEEVSRLRTGITALDVVTGGGLPRRHLTEFYGEESCGKTLAALHCVAAAQSRGETAVWIEGEEFDPPWAKRQGVNMNKLIRVQALSGDLALEAAASILEAANPDLMVFDSYQALGSRRELDGGIDSESYAGGGMPVTWGRMYRRIRSTFNARKADTALIGISQARSKIGGFQRGAPEPQPTQIYVLKHWKAISVLFKKGEPIFDDPKSDKRRIVSREFHVKCKKNKTAPPERVSHFTYRFRGETKGIDRAEALVRLGKAYELIEGTKWLTGYGIRAQGVDNFTEALAKKPVKMTELETDILAAVEDERK